MRYNQVVADGYIIEDKSDFGVIVLMIRWKVIFNPNLSGSSKQQ
jgi:hypothetical protein